MYSLIPRDDAPLTISAQQEAAVDEPMNFGQLLESFTPSIFLAWTILGINVIVFLAMILSGFNPDQASNQRLLQWGADFGPATITAGEWWRILTSMFVHIGIVHLGFNMLVLAQIGPLMERLLGKFAFLVVYLVSGVAGAITSLGWNPYVISAGASGAIFGLYGALIGFLCFRRDSVPGPVLSKILKSALLFLGYNAVFGVLHAGTDLADHAGGLLGGFICGLAISNPITAGYARRRTVRAAAVALAGAVVMVGVTTRLPRPVDLQEQVKSWGAVERKTVAAYQAILDGARTQHLRDGQVADRLQAEVIRPWAAERQVLAGLAGLPNQQQHLVTVLLDYMDARQRAWSSLVQGLQTQNPTLMKEAFKQELEAQKLISALQKRSQ